jgi:hypothetical protein
MRPALAALALCAALAASPSLARAEARFVAELAASPVFSLSTPFRGCGASVLAGFSLEPFEAALRGGGSYDSGLETGTMRFDFVAGLGTGLRAIVGCLLLFDEPLLPGSGEGGVHVSSGPEDWPNRFGLGTTLFDFPLRRRGRDVGLKLALDAELIYTSYRVDAKTALAGAAAFAAGVEASLALRLRWESGSRYN